MGKFDSSKTRVVPLFKNLLKKDETGCSWLPKLISLPEGEHRISQPLNFNFLIREHRWGKDEKKLDPPVALLSWLIRHPGKPLSGDLSSDPTTREKRRQWIEGSRDLIIEGLGLLRNNPDGEDWHIFEGQTQPDVYIETDDLIVVIEGKRTEKEPTTATKWMEVRSQMLRHLDCAWEIRGNKQLFGFFIVERNGLSVDIPPQWKKSTADTISPKMIASSLPHRGPEEQKEIASCFIGVTTWQRVCQELGLDFSEIRNSVVNGNP
jgi:hypothetical protein